MSYTLWRLWVSAPGSKEFYQYVFWAQACQDEETEKMFHKLNQRVLAKSSLAL